MIDNASDDGSARILATHPEAARVVRLRRNSGYAGGMAIALSHVDTPLMAWLNDDAAPGPGWLAALEDALDSAPDAAAAGSRLERPDGALQSLGVRLTADGHGADVTESGAAPFGFCGGAALLRTRALREAGGVPAGFFCYYEDTDTAWRLRLAGWDVLAVPAARAVHLHGASTRPGSAAFHRWNERNRLLMLLRCAPAGAALRQLARFAALTLVLPLRRERPDAANFRFAVRARVLGGVIVRLPGAFADRRRIGARRAVGRGALWRRWAAG